MTVWLSGAHRATRSLSGDRGAIVPGSIYYDTARRRQPQPALTAVGTITHSGSAVGAGPPAARSLPSPSLRRLSPLPARWDEAAVYFWDCAGHRGGGAGAAFCVGLALVAVLRPAAARAGDNKEEARAPAMLRRRSGHHWTAAPVVSPPQKANQTKLAGRSDSDRAAQRRPAARRPALPTNSLAASQVKPEPP